MVITVAVTALLMVPLPSACIGAHDGPGLAAHQELPAARAQAPLDVLDARIRAAHDKVLPAVAAILGVDAVSGEIDEAACATVISRSGLVVTAAHCLGDPGDEVQLRLGDGREVTATTLGMDRTRDFGLMRIQGEGPFDFVGIQTKTAELGKAQALLMYGFPDGGEEGRGAVVRLGAFLGVRDDGMLCSECKMMPGDSGGGLFDLDGRLVGINSEIELHEDRNFHVPMAEVVHGWKGLLDGVVVGEFDDWADHALDVRSVVMPPPAPGPAEAEQLVGQCVPGGVAGLGDRLGARLGQEARRVTVRVSSRRDGQVQFCQALVLWERGLCVSKSSRVSSEALRCRLPDGSLVAPEVLGRDLTNDLVLLGIDVPPAFAREAPEGARKESAAAAVGSVVAVVIAEPEQPGVGPRTFGGVLGAPPHRTKRRRWGRLGVTVRSGMDQPAKVSWVRRRQPAREAGVKRGDIIVSLAGEDIPTRGRMHEVLRGTRPEQVVPLVVERAGERLELEVTLGAQSTIDGLVQHVAYETDVSLRRGGFGEVLRHDISLAPEECGGPVFDLQGRVIGVTLGRADRAGCVMLPSAEVLAAVDRLLARRGNAEPGDGR